MCRKMIVVIRISFLIWIPVSSASLFAGDIPGAQRAVIILGLKTHYGFIIPHYKSLKSISATHPWGIEFDAAGLLLSNKAWSNCNCYGRVGASVVYFNYGNPAVLGSSYNLILFGEPYLGFRKKLHMSLRGGIGFTYLTRVYDEVSNPENVFYSSPLSFILQFQLSANYRMNEYLRFKLTGNYNHISNGGARMPNKGMNFPTVSAGMEYFFNARPLEPWPKSKGLLENDPLIYARIFSSITTVPADSLFPDVRKMIAGLEGGVMKGVSNINALGIGMEFSFDGSFREKSERSGTRYSPFIFAPALGHAFIFGKFSFTQQFAWYAYRPFPENDYKFFQRYAIYYQAGKIISIGFSLKAHAQVAEIMDVRAGFVF